MKTNLIRIALIVLSILLVFIMVADTYIAIIFFKMADGNLFEKLDVVNEYNLFEKFYLGAYLMIFTTILLASMLGLLIKVFILKK